MRTPISSMPRHLADRRPWAVLAFAVHAVEGGGDLGELGDELGVGGGAVEAEELELAGEVGREIGELIEAAGFEDDLVVAQGKRSEALAEMDSVSSVM